MSDYNPMNRDGLPYLQAIERGYFLHSCLVKERDMEIVPAAWQHVCSCRFGEGRLCSWSSTTKWTGDCYRYDIFRRGHERQDKQIALRWSNGSGDGWLVCEEKDVQDQQSLLAVIAEITVEERRWDACHFIYNTYRQSWEQSAKRKTQELHTAFVQGRLKKRKREGRVFVEVRPATI